MNEECPMLDLRQVRSFAAVAHEGSFTRAASRLHYAQSSVTAQVHALEEELGVPLFDRIGRTVALTAAGSEFLEFVGRMYGLARPVARERARALLGLFELEENSRKLIAEYSKGMRKRVAMAASLIHHPELFLMDEPFEGVDAVGARLMKDILVDQVQRGATVFLTSHILEGVIAITQKIANAKKWPPGSILSR